MVRSDYRLSITALNAFQHVRDNPTKAVLANAGLTACISCVREALPFTGEFRLFVQGQQREIDTSAKPSIKKLKDLSAMSSCMTCSIDKSPQLPPSMAASTATPRGRIHRRAERDMVGRDRWIPMSPTVRAAVDHVRALNPAIGEWPLFPAPACDGRARRGKDPEGMDAPLRACVARAR